MATRDIAAPARRGEKPASSPMTLAHGPLSRCRAAALCGLAAALGCAGAPALAGAGALEERVVVVAERVPDRTSQPPFAALTLDAEAIRRSQAVSLESLLDGLPGVSVSSAGGHGSLTSMFVRGGASDHSLVLVDGVPVHALSSDAARLEFLPPGLFAQVEVLRGPRSALYGSQGIGGVVRLLSAPPRPPGQPADSLSARASHYVGSHGLAGVALSSRYRDGGRDVHWSALAERADGIDRHEAGSDDRDGADLYALRWGARGDAGAGEWRIDAAARRGRGEYDNPFASADRDGARSVVTERQARLDWRGPLAGDWRVLARLGGFRGRDLAEDDAPLESSSERRVLSVQFLRPSEDGEWRGILDWTEERYDVPGRAPLNRSRRRFAAVGGLWSRRVGAQLLEASVRWDHSGQFGAELSPQLAWALDAGAWRWRLGYGEGFKAPSFSQLYQDFPAFSFYANPDLRPERSRGVEAGLRRRGSESDVELTWFDTRVRGLIDAVAAARADDPDAFVQANVKRARMRGVEFALARSVGSARFVASATWLDAVNAVSGRALLRRPGLSGRAELSWPRARGSLALELTGRRDWTDLGDVEMPGYALANLRWERRLQSRFWLGLSLNNLANRRYQTLDGYHNARRNAVLRLAYNL